MNVWVLECWTKKLYPNADGRGSDTSVVGVFKSKKLAKDYASKNSDYAGKYDDWFWNVYNAEVGENENYEGVEYFGDPSFFTRDGVDCDHRGDYEDDCLDIDDSDEDSWDEEDDDWDDEELYDEEVEEEKEEAADERKLLIESLTKCIALIEKKL